MVRCRTSRCIERRRDAVSTVVLSQGWRYSYQGDQQDQQQAQAPTRSDTSPHRGFPPSAVSRNQHRNRDLLPAQVRFDTLPSLDWSYSACHNPSTPVALNVFVFSASFLEQPLSSINDAISL